MTRMLGHTMNYEIVGSSLHQSSGKGLPQRIGHCLRNLIRVLNHKASFVSAHKLSTVPPAAKVIPTKSKDISA